MKRRFIFPLITAFLLSYAVSEAQPLRNADEQTQTGSVNQQVIAFGSCNKPAIDGKMWSAIADNDPELFIWLGDIIYGDTHDMRLLRSKYQELTYLPEYQKFARKTTITGVWDDHDYGVNDGDKSFPKKKESRDLLFDFLDVPILPPLFSYERSWSENHRNIAFSIFGIGGA